MSVELPIIKDAREEAFVTMEVNKVLLELKKNGGGPVHINLISSYSRDFTIKELPLVQTIRRYQAWISCLRSLKGRSVFLLVFIASLRRVKYLQSNVSVRLMMPLLFATIQAVIMASIDYNQPWFNYKRMLNHPWMFWI